MKLVTGWALATAFVVAGVVACTGGESSSSSSSSGSSGKSSSSGSSGSSGSGVGGSWDLVATESGRSQGTGTLVISSDTFDLTIGDVRMKYTANGTTGTLTWQPHASAATESITVERTSAAFDTGALPLDLGGTWKVTQATSPGSQCSGTIGALSTAQCSNVQLPQPFQDPRDGEIYSGKRTSTASSIFGDLGGEWTFRGSSASDGCQATFNGSQVLLNCDGAMGQLKGGATITFAADQKSLSGTTTMGIELAGQKR